MKIWLILFSVLATAVALAESSGTWTQVGDDIDGEAADDQSGHSVSMSSDGTRVAIGARYNDGTGTWAGHVRVYAESGGTWTQVGDDFNGEAAFDYFGQSVSMSSDGTRVAIGAVFNDGNGGNATTGHVRVYAESGGTWTQVGADIDGEAAGDQSGQSVSMSSDGTRVAIGAIYNDGNGDNAGHVRVFSASASASCDASTAPTNGVVGDCTNSLASGSTCQPTCDSGYTVSGTSSCTAGTLTAATCSANPCDASAAPTNGGAGDCTGSLASGSSCTPSCDSGYALSGIRSCSAGILTDTAACTANSPSPANPSSSPVPPLSPSPPPPELVIVTDDDEVSGGVIAGAVIGTVAGAAVVGVIAHRVVNNYNKENVVEVTVHLPTRHQPSTPKV